MKRQNYNFTLSTDEKARFLAFSSSNGLALGTWLRALMYEAESAGNKFNPDDITLIKHTKKRADTTASDKHYHLIVPHYQPIQCKSLDTRNSFA